MKARLPVPPRQFAKGVTAKGITGFSSKGRRHIGDWEFGIREGLEIQQSHKDFTSTVRTECLENLEDMDTQADDVRFYMEDRIEDENLNSLRQGFLTDHASDSLNKKRRISYEEFETDKVRASLLSFGADNRELPIDKERIPSSHSRFLGGENIDNRHNNFNRLSPAIATKYSELPSDLIKAADYERLYSDCNRLATIDDRFLLNDTMKTEVGLHNSRRPVITNEHDSCLFERAGKTAHECDVLMNNILDHKHYIDNDVAPGFPSESFESSFPRVRGTAGHRKFLTKERVMSEHDPGSGLGINFSSVKVVNPSDSSRGEFNERRSPSHNLQDYVEGLPCSASLNMRSGFDARIERQRPGDFGFIKTCSVDNGQHLGTLPRPLMSAKSSAFHQPRQSSGECFGKPFTDIQFPRYTSEAQNFMASNSIFHDAVVTRSVACGYEFPSVHHERSISFSSCQNASAAEEYIPHHAGGEFLGLSEGKSFEAEGSNRYYTYDFGNKVPFRNYHNYNDTDEISSGIIKSPSSDHRTYKFSPSTLASLPLNETDAFSGKKSPLAFDDHAYVVSQGMQKYIPGRNDERKCISQQINDEIYAGDELLSSYADSAEFDIHYQGKDPINLHSQFSREYRPDVINDNLSYYRSLEGPSSDTENCRRSVFARLKPTLKISTLEEQEEDADFYGASSVHEVMEMLHRNQNVQMKNLKKVSSLSKHCYEEEEMERNNEKVLLEDHVEHGQSKSASLKINRDANPTTQQYVDDKPKETRMVEFKRRREKNKILDDKILERNVIREEAGESRENKETMDTEIGENKETTGPLDKQGGKRRKLIRPVFGQNHLVNGANRN